MARRRREAAVAYWAEQAAASQAFESDPDDTLILLFLWVRFKEGRPFSSVGFRGRNPVGKLLLGLAIGALMMTVAVLIAWATGQYGTGLSVHLNLGADSLVWILLLLPVFVVQASTCGSGVSPRKSGT
mgnify:CR=1 FL=1